MCYQNRTSLRAIDRERGIALLGGVLLVADLLHPVDVLPADDVRNGDMAHGIGCRRSMPCFTPGGVQITSPGLISRF